VRRYNGKIVAILGTIIIHLLAGIVFMSFKLYSLKTKEAHLQKFEIEFAEVEQEKMKQKPPELPPTSVENVLHDDKELLNIARNLASKSEEKIDPKDYINQVKNELIQSGKLSKDNYLDNPTKVNQATEDDELAVRAKAENQKKEEDKAKESNKMAANYKGPTRIYYDLEGRTHTYLPIPIYKCEGSGKIVLLIEVNQGGQVENASVIEGQSTTRDDCLIETAVKTALVSRFDPNDKAPRIQKGTLTYLFVAQ
jgi:hypothetical protein